MGKKPLVTLTLAFLGGVALAEPFSYFPRLTALAVGLSLLITPLFRKSGLPYPAIMIAGGIGFIFPHLPAMFTASEDLSVYQDEDTIQITARVASAPQHYPDKVRLTMESLKRRTPHGTEPLQGFFRLTLRRPETTLRYGDIVEMPLTLRPFQQFENPGTFPVADYLKRQGLSGQVIFENEDPIKVVRHGRNWILRGIYKYRDAIRQSGNGWHDHPSVMAILFAMTIGESGFLSDAIRDIFTASGTNHILSISGSHLAMISFFVFGLSRFVLLRLPSPLLLRLSLYKIPSQWAALIVIPIVTFYALVSGMAVATERSLIMILAYLLAVWIGRSNDIQIALALAALIIVIMEPSAIFDLSFQLSFLAVLFMILTLEWWRYGANRQNPLAPWERDRVNRPAVATCEKIRQAVGTLFLTSCGATLGTAPLTLYHFHQFSGVGLLANMILIPFVGFILLPFGLVSALVSPFVGSFPLAGVHQAVGSFYIEMTRWFANLPAANLHYASPPLGLVIIFYALVPLLFIKRASWKQVGQALIVFFVLFLGWGSLRIPPENLTVTFLDVGQGDAALMEFPEGETLLVDAGSGKSFDRGRHVLAPFLWEKKIKTLDYIVGTHPQEDHMGGFPFLIDTFNVKNILTNGMTVSSPFYQSFLEAAGRKGITPRGVSRSDPPLLISGCKIVFLNPQKKMGVSDDDFDLNNHSVVFLLSCAPGGRGPRNDPGYNAAAPPTFLFTGDIEEEAMETISENADFLQSDVLKVPHHGSRSSLHESFISRVSPRVAVFSAGRTNRYGHPHIAVLAHYARQGIPIYRTDYDGAVTVAWDSSGLAIGAFRREKLTKVRLYPFQVAEEWDNLRKIFRWGL